MNRLGKILRYTLNIIFLLVMLGAVAIYLAVHFNLAHKITQSTILPLLADKLQTRVELGEVEVDWLNQVAINDIIIYDQEDDTLLYANRAMVSYDMMPLLRQQLIINSIQLIGFDARIRQKSPDDAPNFKFLIDALAPRKDSRRQFINDLSIHALHLRRGRLSYRMGNGKDNRLSIPDYRNLNFENITAAMQVEISHLSGIDVRLKRFSLDEREGMSIEGRGAMHNDSIHIELERLLFDNPLPAHLDMKGVADLNLYHLDKIAYQTHIERAEISTGAVQRLAEAYHFELPETALLWRDSLEQIGLSGMVTGVGTESIHFDGSLRTDGRVDLSASTQLDYLRSAPQPLNAQVDMMVKNFPYQRHNYHNIRVKAQTDLQKIEFKVDSNDPSCRMDLNGQVTLGDSTQHISVEGDIHQFNPNALHLTEWGNLEGFSLSTHTQSDITLHQGQWPLGSLVLDDVHLMSPSDTLRIHAMEVQMQLESERWVGVVDAPFVKLGCTQTSAFAYLTPNERLSRLLGLPAYLSQNATFTATWDSIAHHVAMECNIPELTTSDGKVTALITAEGQSETHSPMPKQLQTRLALDYITPKHLMSTAFNADIIAHPLFIQLGNTEVSVDGHPFSSEGATLSQSDNGTYTLTGFTLNNGNQEIGINGYMRNTRDMRAQIHTNDLQIDFFLDMLGKGYLDFGGYASGDISLNADSILHLETERLQIRDFSYMDRVLGDNLLTAFYDLENRNLYIDVDIDHKGNHTRAGGEVLIGPPGVNTYLDLSFDINQLPIDFCDYWVGGFLHDFHANGSGKVRLYGDTDHLNLTGHPWVDANFTHELLGARFNLTDTVHLETGESEADGLIRLNNALLTDRYGQRAAAHVTVHHNYLSNFEYDAEVAIERSSNGFMVFDYPNQRNGELYWGQLYGNGRCQLHGSTATKRHRIGLQMEPAGKSVLYLSPGEENFSDNAYNFLSFRDKSTLSYNGDEWAMLSRVRTNTVINNDDNTYIEADLQIHANEHCFVNVQMDPLAEDRLLCRGSGDLALHYDSNHDINITGNYDISSGSYTITMKGDLMSKSFQLQKGSSVSFSGSPSNADLNLNAVYSIPSANLKDLDASFGTVASLSRTTLPVDCKLLVEGSLSAPQISFDLEVKNVSDDVQTLIHNIIGTPEMLNREVFYLLLFGRFYTPEYATAAQSNNTGNELSSFASATLTSQLNNLLGHMSDNFTLGTNIHTEKGDFSDMEMDLSMQTSLFSDRLLLSGNLSYRDPANRIGMANSTNSFIGDFDVEFLINTSGTLRAKAYSHYNERDYSINNALTTQGIGIIMRKDFNSVKELLPWHPKTTK